MTVTGVWKTQLRIIIYILRSICLRLCVNMHLSINTEIQLYKNFGDTHDIVHNVPVVPVRLPAAEGTGVRQSHFSLSCR